MRREIEHGTESGIFSDVTMISIFFHIRHVLPLVDGSLLNSAAEHTVPSLPGDRVAASRSLDVDELHYIHQLQLQLADLSEGC